MPASAKTNQYKPTEKIYLTAKTRMTTEARLRRTGKVSHLLLSWYSFWAISFSVIELSKKFSVENSNIVFIALSVLTFGLSLYIYGERYHERADQFRDCYIALQELYQSNLNDNEKMEKYQNILKYYENQTDSDYDDMLFDAAIRGQKLQNARGQVSIAKPIAIKIAIKRAFTYAFVAFLFAFSVYFLFNFVTPVQLPAS